MLISRNWLSQYVSLEGLDDQALSDLLTHRGLEVDSFRDLSQGFENVVVGEILSKEPHPDADRLSICHVTNGQKKLQIVCGARNMDVGDRVALAQEGASLPNGMTIKAGKIRGMQSQGMLCSEAELGLSDESDGILILPASEQAGDSVAEILNRKDTVFDLGITPNRGDCLSHIGIAREVSAATGKKLLLPKIAPLPRLASPIKTKLNAEDAATQFHGCILDGVQVGPSPDWLVARLEAVGARSINNIVDATNFVLQELGQPTHAYDADRIQSDALEVRFSHPGESLQLLDDTSVQLDGSELVISDGSTPVALAGVMGGRESSVTEKTTRLFLECAEFSPLMVRKAASRHQKHTDASQRFERSIDSGNCESVLSHLAAVIMELAGGKIVGVASSKKPIQKTKKISFDPDFVDVHLGLKLRKSEIERILKGLGCEVIKGASQWKIQPPSWRWDLRIPEDLTEEVARSVGYDRIPSTIPKLSSRPKFSRLDPRSQNGIALDRAKDAMIELGFLESVQYAFTSASRLTEFGIHSAVPVQNPMSEEQSVLVPSLIPGLVDSAIRNFNSSFGEEQLSMRLFEIRPVFSARDSVRAEGNLKTTLKEDWRLTFLMTGNRLADGLRSENHELSFLDVKGVFEQLMMRLGVRGARVLKASQREGSDAEWFHPGQSSGVWLGKNLAGRMGQLHPRLNQKLKIRQPLWVAEWDWAMLSQMARSEAKPVRVQAWSEHPVMTRDFSLIVRRDVTAEQIQKIAIKNGRPLAKVAKVFDIYQGSQVPEGMTSVAVRVIFSSEGRSLHESEADQASSQILSKWRDELGAELRN